MLTTGWPSAIVKPAWHYHARCGFGSRGVFTVALSASFEGNRSVEEVAAELADKIAQCAPPGRHDATLMRYEPSVHTNWELRTWWLLKRYSHTIATRPNAVREAYERVLQPALGNLLPSSLAPKLEEIVKARLNPNP